MPASEFLARCIRLLNINDPSQPEAEKVKEVREKLLDSYQDKLIGQQIYTIERLNDLCLEI